jgi:hypothetical protein
MAKYVTLREFRSSELIFDERETRAILAFIFNTKISVVGSMAIDDRVRSFAQGLLLEAVDASYSLGFVQALTGSIAMPAASLTVILNKFGKKAAHHWFQHASGQDLLRIRIYEIVRRDLAWSFGRVLLMYANGTAMRRGHTAALVAYASGVGRSGASS